MSSLFLQQKYLNIISGRLSHFKKKKDTVWNFRCPLCGDSQRNQKKARGFIYVRDNTMWYSCHNCGKNHTFNKFLELVSQLDYDQYVLECIRENPNYVYTHPKPTIKEIITHQFKTKNHWFDDTITIFDLPFDHPAYKYLFDRKIPGDFFKELFYVENLHFAIHNWPWIFDITGDDYIPKDKRILIPFYGPNYELWGFQARAIDPKTELRYITYKIKDAPKLYGMHRLDRTKRIYVLEGPFDSMFIPNAIAVCGSNLESLQPYVNECSDLVLVFDNEPRNIQIVQKMDQALKDNYKVVVWPETIHQKDVNDMILHGGYTQTEIKDVIDNNICSGLVGKFEFSQWRKC